MRKKQILDEEDIFEEGNFLEKEELVIFLNISKKQKFPQDFPIFSTLAYSGLRRGELCVLKWDDINFIEKTISITKTYYNKKGKIDEFDIIPPKTKSSKRIIDIDDFLVNVLRKLKAWQNEYILANGKNYTNFNFVFINTNMYPGYPLHPNYIYQHMLKITKKMELTKTLSPHSLRHTHASLYIEAGVELRDIAERLGHDNLDTLQKIYAHTTRGQKKKTAEKFSQLMTKVLEQTSL
nr:site-specific integrase [Gracilibacillus alcaliphilus]